MRPNPRPKSTISAVTFGAPHAFLFNKADAKELHAIYDARSSFAFNCAALLFGAVRAQIFRIDVHAHLPDCAERRIECRLEDGVVAGLEITGEGRADGLLAFLGGTNHIHNDTLVQWRELRLRAIAPFRPHDVVVLANTDLDLGHARDRRHRGDLPIAGLALWGAVGRSQDDGAGEESDQEHRSDWNLSHADLALRMLPAHKGASEGLSCGSVEVRRQQPRHGSHAKSVAGILPQWRQESSTRRRAPAWPLTMERSQDR